MHSGRFFFQESDKPKRKDLKILRTEFPQQNTQPDHHTIIAMGKKFYLSFWYDSLKDEQTTMEKKDV